MKASCLIAVFLGVLLGAAGLGGCRVGKGVGAASGTLFELGCSKAGDYCYAPDQCGTADLPVPFDLKPSFFAGEPIDDLRQVDPGSAFMSNRLTIRLQRSGKQIEQNDVLTFDGYSQTTTNNNFAANTQFNGFTFTPQSGMFTLGGNAVKLGGDICLGLIPQ